MSDSVTHDPQTFQYTPPGAALRPTARVLVTDDSEVVRTLVERFLQSRGYEVVTADSGAAALEALGRGRFELMLSDVQMPGMLGTELVPKALEIDPELAVIMLTGVNDAPTATETLTEGAYDYLVKPVKPDDLEQAIGRAMRRRALLIEQRRVERMVREEVALRTAELERERATLRALVTGLAETMLNVLEMKDPSLRGHSQRVAELAASLAQELGLGADVVEDVRLAGWLHDVGKSGVRESVLRNPGKLTGEELAHARDHVRIGTELLSPLKHLGAALRYVREHHERCDGSGYPAGLRGEEISLGGRILAVANAYDALTSKRSYREPIAPQKALDSLAAQAGTAFDPRVCAALGSVVAGRKSLVFLEDTGA